MHLTYGALRVVLSCRDQMAQATVIYSALGLTIPTSHEIIDLGNDLYLKFLGEGNQGITTAEGIYLPLAFSHWKLPTECQLQQVVL